MEKGLDLEKLYFGVMVNDFNTGKMKTVNLFGSTRILRSVASYVLMSDKNRKFFKEQEIDPVHYCFNDCWARCEWEFVTSSLFAKNAGKEQKMDVFTMYVLPNKDYLMSLVNRVTKASAKRVLKKYGRKKAIL